MEPCSGSGLPSSCIKNQVAEVRIKALAFYWDIHQLKLLNDCIVCGENRKSPLQRCFGEEAAEHLLAENGISVDFGFGFMHFPLFGVDKKVSSLSIQNIKNTQGVVVKTGVLRRGKCQRLLQCGSDKTCGCEIVPGQSYESLDYKNGVDEGELVTQKGNIASFVHPAYHTSTTRNSASCFASSWREIA